MTPEMQDGVWYVAGPMTGIPQFNFPLFAEVTKTLREFGMSVISPAENDSPNVQRIALASPDGDRAALEKESNETWGEILGEDVKLVADKVNYILLLPGWRHSSGARLEAFVGTLCGHGIFEWRNNEIHDIRSLALRHGILGV